MPYATKKGADKPAHPRSLISTFVVRCRDSIISLVCNFMTLASFCGCTGRFESCLVENPEYRFSRDQAHVMAFLVFVFLFPFGLLGRVWNSGVPDLFFLQVYTLLFNLEQFAVHRYMRCAKLVYLDCFKLLFVLDIT